MYINVVTAVILLCFVLFHHSTAKNGGWHKDVDDVVLCKLPFIQMDDD